MSNTHAAGGQDETAAGKFILIISSALAVLLVSIVIGLVIQSRFEPDAVRVDAAIEEAVQVVVARLS